MLGISDATVHALADAMQGVVEEGVGAALPTPSPRSPLGRVAALSILHLRFACGVLEDSDLPPIWEEVTRTKGRMEGLATLNQTLLRGIPSFQRFFGGRLHFSASLSLLTFVNNASLLNPSLDPSCSGGGGSRLG